MTQQDQYKNGEQSQHIKKSSKLRRKHTRGTINVIVNFFNEKKHSTNVCMHNQAIHIREDNKSFYANFTEKITHHNSFVKF